MKLTRFAFHRHIPRKWRLHSGVWYTWHGSYRLYLCTHIMPTECRHKPLPKTAQRIRFSSLIYCGTSNSHLPVCITAKTATPHPNTTHIENRVIVLTSRWPTIFSSQIQVKNLYNRFYCFVTTVFRSYSCQLRFEITTLHTCLNLYNCQGQLTVDTSGRWQQYRQEKQPDRPEQIREGWECILWRSPLLVKADTPPSPSTHHHLLVLKNSSVVRATLLPLIYFHLALCWCVGW